MVQGKLRRKGKVTIHVVAQLCHDFKRLLNAGLSAKSRAKEKTNQEGIFPEGRSFR